MRIFFSSSFPLTNSRRRVCWISLGELLSVSLSVLRFFYEIYHHKISAAAQTERDVVYCENICAGCSTVLHSLVKELR